MLRSNQNTDFFFGHFLRTYHHIYPQNVIENCTCLPTQYQKLTQTRPTTHSSPRTLKCSLMIFLALGIPIILKKKSFFQNRSRFANTLIHPRSPCMVHLATFKGDFRRVNVGRYSIHEAFGFENINFMWFPRPSKHQFKQWDNVDDDTSSD